MEEQLEDTFGSSIDRKNIELSLILFFFAPRLGYSLFDGGECLPD